MIGINSTSFSFNIIPSVQNSVFAGAWYIIFNIRPTPDLIITPDLELNFNIYFKKFIFIVGLSSDYEFLFIYYDPKYTPGKNPSLLNEFNITLSFGFSFRDKY